MPRAGETKGGDATTRFRELGLPNESYFHNRGYLARIGSWRKLPSGSGTTEEMLPKAEREVGVGGLEAWFLPSSHFPTICLTPLAESNLKLGSLENAVCGAHSFVVQSGAGK